MFTTRRVTVVGSLVCGVLLAATAPIPFFLATDTADLKLRVVDYLLLWAVAVPTFIAFFGLYPLRQDLRDAIAGSFVVAFLVILCLASGLRLGDTPIHDGSIRSIVLSNFMTLVGAVVAFYLGSEAAIRVGKSYQEAKNPAPGGSQDSTVADTADSND